MTLSAAFDQADAGQVATTAGWSDFISWVDGLDAAKHPEPIHLAEHGWSQNLPALESQLQAAIQDSPPVLDVASVVQGLLQRLAQRGSAEVLTVSDGVGA